MNEIFINKTQDKENKRIAAINLIVDDFIIKTKMNVSVNNFIKETGNIGVAILNINLRSYDYNYNDEEPYLIQINNNSCVQKYGSCCKDIIEKITNAFAQRNILVNVTYVIEWYEGDGFFKLFRKIKCDESYVKGVVFYVKAQKYLNSVVSVDDLDN